MRHFLLLLYLLIMALPCQAQTVNEVRDAIQKQQGKADQRQGRIESLEGKEKKLKKQLTALEKDIEVLKQDIAQREEELIRIESSEAQAREDYRSMQAVRTKLVEELRGLVVALWPIHNQKTLGRLRGLDSWQKADQRFTWLKAVYQATDERLKDVVRISNLMAENLEQQAKLAREAAAKLAAVNSSKDQLLRKRLLIRRSIRKTESSITSLEKELTSILSVIKDLNYKLKSQRTKRFADNKKLLPWPAKGVVASSFSPRAKPARRGIGLATADKAPVKTVFWGKVVHADVVRGFGRVVIVYHGHDYYSVYAYLASSKVVPGQEVEKDEHIGNSGFDPRTKRPGLYFELRSGSKPINPLKWLYPK